MKLKKIFAAAVAAVMAAASLSVSASAWEFKDRKNVQEISSGVEYSGNSGKTALNWYKFTASKSGTLKLSYSTSGANTNLFVLDSSGEQLKRTDIKLKSGKIEGSDTSHLFAHEKGGSFSATLSFKVSKGDHYIFICPGWERVKYGGKFTIKATFPEEKKDDDAKIDASTAVGDILNLSTVIEEGDSLKLAATPVKNGDKVKYSSSDTSVATVDDSGKIKGKNAGTAVITINCGKTQLNVKVTVIDD